MRRAPKRKWFLVIGYIGQGLGLLAMGWVAMTMEGTAAGWTVIGLLVWISLARGFASVASKDVIGKTVPKTRRGVLNGYSASAAGLVTLMFGLVLALEVTRQWQNFGFLLVAAAVASAMAAIVYAAVEEYSGAVDGGANGLVAAFKSAKILVTDKDFRHFITVRALMMSSGLSAPFFILIAQQSGGGQGLASLGMFVIVSGLASMVSGVVWGKFSDASSRKVMLTTSIAISLVCLITALLEFFAQTSLVLMLSLYFLLSVIHEGVRVGRKTYVLDLAGGSKRTDYVAVGNTLIGLLLLAVGMFSAVLANLSITWALMLFASMGALGFLLGLRLPEV